MVWTVGLRLETLTDHDDLQADQKHVSPDFAQASVAAPLQHGLWIEEERL